MAGERKTLGGVLKNIGATVKGLTGKIFGQREDINNIVVSSPSSPELSGDTNSSPSTSRSSSPFRDSASSVEENTTNQDPHIKAAAQIFESVLERAQYHSKTPDKPLSAPDPEDRVQAIEKIANTLSSLHEGKTPEQIKKTNAVLTNVLSDMPNGPFGEVAASQTPVIRLQNKLLSKTQMPEIDLGNMDSKLSSIQPKDIPQAYLNALQTTNNVLNTVGRNKNGGYAAQIQSGKQADYVLNNVNLPKSAAKDVAEGFFLAERVLQEKHQANPEDSTKGRIENSPDITKANKEAISPIMEKYVNEPAHAHKQKEFTADAHATTANNDKGKEEIGTPAKQAGSTNNLVPKKPASEINSYLVKKTGEPREERLPKPVLEDQLVKDIGKLRAELGLKKSVLEDFKPNSLMTPSPSHVANLTKGGEGIIEK